MKRVLIIVLSLTLLVCWVNGAIAEPAVKIGVLAKRGAEKAMQQWGATGEYLSKRLHRQVEIVPLKFVEIEPALKHKTINFLLANSAFYARFQEEYQLKAICTMVNKKGIFALDKFGGVVFVRKNSRINDLQDIRGKRFMCVKFSSFGGAHMALRLLKESGINPERDCAAFTEGGTHDNVVMAVLNRKTDVGTVRSDTLERMADEGKINMDSFHIINEIKDGFQFVHSTRLYPEWPIAACGNTDAKLARDVAKALILLKSTDKAMKDAKVYSWTYPANYSDVAACLRVIGAL
jgi:ABC-type phosphate/phosphonate transport system substrate-binding protein